MTLSLSQKRRLAATATSNLQLQNTSRALVLAPRRNGNTNRTVVVRQVPTNRSPGKRRRNQGVGRNQNMLANVVSRRVALQGSTALGMKPPRINGSYSTVVAGQEMVATLLGTSAFSGIAVAMVPALFPWLDGLALNYSQFRWLKLHVYFQTTSPTSYGGDVGIGAIYSAGTDPNSMQEMSVLAHAQVCPVWDKDGCNKPMVLDVNRPGKETVYSYASRSELAALEPSDVVKYVPFYSVIGIQTSVNGQAIGRIFVDYEIEFLNPIPQRMNVTPTEPGLMRAFGAKAEEREQEDPATQVAKTLSLLTDLVLREKQGEAADPLSGEEEDPGESQK